METINVPIVQGAAERIENIATNELLPLTATVDSLKGGLSSAWSSSKSTEVQEYIADIYDDIKTIQTNITKVEEGISIFATNVATADASAKINNGGGNSQNGSSSTQ